MLCNPINALPSAGKRLSLRSGEGLVHDPASPELATSGIGSRPIESVLVAVHVAVLVAVLGAGLVEYVLVEARVTVAEPGLPDGTEFVEEDEPGLSVQIVAVLGEGRPAVLLAVDAAVEASVGEAMTWVGLEPEGLDRSTFEPGVFCMTALNASNGGVPP